MIIALVLGVTYFVVFMERGQRRITVNYARRQGGRQAYMNQSSYLAAEAEYVWRYTGDFCIKPDHVPGHHFHLDEHRFGPS